MRPCLCWIKQPASHFCKDLTLSRLFIILLWFSNPTITIGKPMENAKPPRESPARAIPSASPKFSSEPAATFVTAKVNTLAPMSAPPIPPHFLDFS